jgi:hypothetical protein
METWRDLMDMIGYWIEGDLTDESFYKYVMTREFDERSQEVVKMMRRTGKKRVKTS